MLTTRRTTPVALAAISALALAGCGSAGTTSGAGSTSATSATSSSASAGGSAGPTVVSESATTVVVKHAQGTTTAPKNPKKVAVLDFGVLDTIDALDAEGSVHAVTKQGLPTFLADTADGEVADIGSMKEPKIEQVAAAKPDLILVGARSAARYAELSKIAPTLDLTTSDPDLVRGLTAQATTIGAFYDKQTEVKAALARLDTKIAAAKEKSANAGTGLVLMTSGGKVSAFGPQSRFGVVHTTLGVPTTSIKGTTDRHGQAVSFELIRTANPDHLFVVDRDSAIGESGRSAQQVLDNALVRGTTAWSKKQVTYLDGQRWYVVGTGLANVPAMVDEVVAGL